MGWWLVVGGVNSATYIRFMDWKAKQAQRLLKRTGRLTVIAQDNAPIHTSSTVQQRIPISQEQGLYLFQLPKYCSEMNPIETEWHQLKAHEMREEMFEHSYDIAIGVIGGLRHRDQSAGYKTKRFNFQTQQLIKSPLLTTQENYYYLWPPTYDENPIEKAYFFCIKIREGTSRKTQGVYINIDKNTSIYSYLICDLMPQLMSWVSVARLTPSTHNNGYFRYNEIFKVFVEIMTFDKLLLDAEKRNKILLDQLSLNQLIHEKK